MQIKQQDTTALLVGTFPACFEFPFTHPWEHVRLGIEDNLSKRKKIVWGE
jgi:hypothetical protein